MMEGAPVFDHDDVIEVYYGSNWYDVVKGTYRELEIPDGGQWITYEDRYTQAVVVIPAPIVAGWKYIDDPDETKVIETEEEETPATL